MQDTWNLIYRRELSDLWGLLMVTYTCTDIHILSDTLDPGSLVEVARGDAFSGTIMVSMS
jgi:hypothetical protein